MTETSTSALTQNITQFQGFLSTVNRVRITTVSRRRGRPTVQELHTEVHNFAGRKKKKNKLACRHEERKFRRLARADSVESRGRHYATASSAYEDDHKRRLLSTDILLKDSDIGPNSNCTTQSRLLWRMEPSGDGRVRGRQAGRPAHYTNTHRRLTCTSVTWTSVIDQRHQTDWRCVHH